MPTFDQQNQVVKGDQINVAGDYLAGGEAYNVAGLKNPYLGLRAFTYNERSIYAGRDLKIAAAVRLLTEPGAERSLLFVTGASGSGKSSFVRAGVVPTLEQSYVDWGLSVRRAVLRPSQHPLAGLNQAIHTLGLISFAPFTDIPSTYASLQETPAAEDQISLLVIDQFEEFFTQSNAAERDQFFDLLLALPTFGELPIHIIATIRSDYLPELFEIEQLYAVAKDGIELREFQPNQLAAAIKRPLQVSFPDGKRCFEPALIDKLVVDAAPDASYLPLLQVTLEDLWDGGSLTLARYVDLAEAIRRRAEKILGHAIDSSGRSVPRTEQEQVAVMDLFLDLVDVSLDDDSWRDVRKGRPESFLTEGKPGRRELIDELANSRLLAVHIEPGTEDPSPEDSLG